MGTYLKPLTTALSRLNNKEYLNMMQRILALLTDEETVKKLGVGDLCAAKLTDLVNRSTAHAQTPQMSDADAERGYISNLFAIIRAAKTSPKPDARAAERMAALTDDSKTLCA